MVTITERPHLYSFSLNEIRYVFSVTDPATAGCSVDVELYYHDVAANIGTLLKSFTLYPPADGNVYCHINEFLDSIVTPELPAIAGPTIQPINDQVKKYYIRYRQVTTADATPDWIDDQVNTKFVLMGGVEKMKFQRNNFFVTYLPATKPFLTWQPANRLVFAEEKHYFTYLQTGGFDFTVQVHTVFTDGTTNDTLTSHAPGTNRLFRIKAGANDLGLHLIDPTKQLYYYEISVIRTLGGAILAKPYRFYLEYRYLYNYTDILFFSSLGGIDSIRVKGEVSWEIENTGDDIEHITGNDIVNTDRPRQQYSQVNQLKRDYYKGDAGWLRTPAQQEALLELLISKGRYEIVDGRWIGIVNLKKNLALRLSTDKKWSFPIEWSYGYADPVFTPKNIMLGAGTADVVIPPLPPTPGCTPVQLPSSISLPDGIVGQAYNYSFSVIGTLPITRTINNKPAWMDISITDRTISYTGTPDVSATDIPVSITLNNCSTDSAIFADTIDLTVTAPPAAGARFGNTTFIMSDASTDMEVAYIEGTAGVSVNVRLVEYSNNNSNGLLQVNNDVAFLGYEWTLVLGSGGVTGFDVSISGEPTDGGTTVRGLFQIVSVSSGAIDAPDTFLISKVF